ncbi:uncharacterized protein LOC131234605 [Magnolia sinica]|uniref:uncharacterized protein LOC131234605 n=1 Tax=Magnolia sinica TaxID=86752 RepID=UPI002658C7BC|nr:uncharacterized protein LOC131234605 [Magnolia sinica]
MKSHQKPIQGTSKCGLGYSMSNIIFFSLQFLPICRDVIIGASSNDGTLLVDGLGDGVFLEALGQDFNFLRNTSFNLLQGCRMRNTKTEYISCPSCGRTLFDLQEISAEIREKTAHLPVVSIAIMGCIVNGPGEMADADFGYEKKAKILQALESFFKLPASKQALTQFDADRDGTTAAGGLGSFVRSGGTVTDGGTVRASGTEEEEETGEGEDRVR